MADSKELKPKSFRISDEIFEKFRTISGEAGLNQQETMQLLINAYFMQTQKAGLVEHKANLEQFEMYSTSLIAMYTQALQANHDMRESVMMEFNETLTRKENRIQELENQLIVAKQVKDEEVKKAKYYSDENDRLNGVIESLNTEYNAKMGDLQEMLDDKDKLNHALTESFNDQKHKINDMKADREKLSELQKELLSLKADYSSLASEKSEIERKSELEREKFDMELKRQQEQAQLHLDKSLLEMDKKHQTQIEKLKAAKQSEIDLYQQKYFDLLEQMKK